jgi:hypothetical protein
MAGEKAYRRSKPEILRDDQRTMLRPARQSPERAFSCVLLLYRHAALRKSASHAHARGRAHSKPQDSARLEQAPHGSARPLGSIQRPSRGLYDVGPDQLRAGGVSIGFGGAGSGTIPVVQGAVGLMVAQINQHRFPPRRRAAPSRFQSLLRFSVLFRLLQSVRGELSYDQPVHHPAPRIVHRRSVDDVAPHCRRSSAPPRRRASAAGEALAPSSLSDLTVLGNFR